MVELMCNGTFEDKDPMFASLARKVEALELKKSGQLKYVQDIVCQICETNEHATNDCPILVGRVITIMHKLHNHRFKHTIISKIIMDMHLLEKILKKHCMYSLKRKRQSTLNLLKA